MWDGGAIETPGAVEEDDWTGYRGAWMGSMESGVDAACGRDAEYNARSDMACGCVRLVTGGVVEEGDVGFCCCVDGAVFFSGCYCNGELRG